MKNLVILTLFSFMLVIPSQTNANVLMLDNGTQTEGYQAGQSRAENDVSKGMWIAIGCVTGGMSWLYPEISTPGVPESPIIGKSEDFAAGFRDGYNEKRKRIIQRNSCIGGGILWIGCIGTYIIMVAAAASATPVYY